MAPFIILSQHKGSSCEHNELLRFVVSHQTSMRPTTCTHLAWLLSPWLQLWWYLSCNSHHWTSNESIIVNTSVLACSIGPSVNEHIFHFSNLIFQNWKFLNSAMWEYIEGSTDFSFREPNFCNLFEILATKYTLKNQYLPHLSSENCEINFIKCELLRSFQQHWECPQIPIQFSISNF
jgi:hypothetical protein